ncbi:MAG: hypothetical protein WBM17_02245 [Anaerolineales bacterium]
MTSSQASEITDVVSKIPYRMAFAGGWIDQPFLSRHNPEPPGSMVVVALEPATRFMDRCGMATSTREIAIRLWNGRIPDRPPQQLIRELYAEENRGKAEPSGSQDMAGMIYPGINRLDYDFAYEGGCFPVHVESNNDPAVVRWLEGVIHLVPVAPRPGGYSPLGVINPDPQWIRRLSQSGKDCYSSILAKDLKSLGASMNECMLAWEALLPQTVVHPAITVDLKSLLGVYQSRYAGAMYSGCGGGYLYVASEEVVPGSLHITVKVAGGNDE